MVSIPACHAGDRGSIPRLRVFIGYVSDETQFLLAAQFFISADYWSVTLLRAVQPRRSKYKIRADSIALYYV